MFVVICVLPVLTNKETVPAADSDLNQRNPAYTISAALSYTTQLLSLITYFLDVHLPRRLCYRYEYKNTRYPRMFNLNLTMNDIDFL